MKIITSPAQMQRQALLLKRRGKTIAFVPTMGALHAGHLSLVRRAKKSADIVIVSIYVNPTQFGPKEDFSRYPRKLKEDVQLCRREGVNIIFAPKNLYSSDASTFVEEIACSQGRCGSFRPGHFRGVATVVCKLFNVVQPDIAVFGQKDAQQCEVIEQMNRDIFLPVKIIRAPILRDKNGLALSSRNQYLSPEEYRAALNFPRALKRAVRSNAKSPQQVEKIARALLKKNHEWKIDYVTWANGFLCAAIRIGKTRLIDNIHCRFAKQK
jgi:pantoate--beta-alanine ligase